MPVFELPLVALPSERVALHIFEERYKRMFEHCRETGAALAIVLRTDAGASAIGCAVELTEVLEEFEDGRLNVIVTGRDRVQVLERHQDQARFPTASVELIEEPSTPDADPSAARAALGRLIETVGSDAELGPELRSAYEIAAHVELPVAVKQALLESDSETQRLELLERALDELSEAADRSQQLAELARTNGHAGRTATDSSATLRRGPRRHRVADLRLRSGRRSRGRGRRR